MVSIIVEQKQANGEWLTVECVSFADFAAPELLLSCVDKLVAGRGYVDGKPLTEWRMRIRN